MSDRITCPTCKGSGILRLVPAVPRHVNGTVRIVCKTCKGSGTVEGPVVDARVRPRCRRCGGRLDLWQEAEDDTGEYEIHLICNGKAIDNDAEFWDRWDSLPGDDVARLDRQLERDREATTNRG